MEFDKLWDQAAIQKYVTDEIQENLTLEYKASDALDKTDGRKKEIAKDVSSMANSNGGILIYGVKEYDERDKKHLPEKIDPIKRNMFSKEWLEQVIITIRPKIIGIEIFPVELNTGINDVVYVVVVPQSITAHQATDFRYYKRYNFTAVPMEDYEVRDTMGRLQHPKIELIMKVEISTHTSTGILPGSIPQTSTRCILRMTAKNVGNVVAQYVNVRIWLPLWLLHANEQERIRVKNLDTLVEEGQPYFEYIRKNTIRDVVDYKYELTRAIEKYGPSRYDPILPGLTHDLEIPLLSGFESLSKNALGFSTQKIKWIIHADNAIPINGEICLGDIPVIHNR
jgi:hypothetical protein